MYIDILINVVHALMFKTLTLLIPLGTCIYMHIITSMCVHTVWPENLVGIKIGGLVPSMCFRNIGEFFNLVVRYSIVIRMYAGKTFW